MAIVLHISNLLWSCPDATGRPAPRNHSFPLWGQKDRTNDIKYNRDRNYHKLPRSWLIQLSFKHGKIQMGFKIIFGGLGFFFLKRDRNPKTHYSSNLQNHLYKLHCFGVSCRVWDICCRDARFLSDLMDPACKQYKTQQQRLFTEIVTWLFKIVHTPCSEKFHVGTIFFLRKFIRLLYHTQKEARIYSWTKEAHEKHLLQPHSAL